MVLLSSTCRKSKDCPKDFHNDITISNNSTLTLNWKHFDPDSIYTLNGAPYDEILGPKVAALYKIRGETCWEESFPEGHSKYFLIFDNDTVQAIGWEQISGTNRGLLKRVEVDLDYLTNNDFTIAYP